MKKILFKSLSVVMAIALLSAQSFNVYAREITVVTNELDESVFTFDQASIDQELSELNALDAYLETNETATFETLVNENSPLVANVAGDATPMGMAGQDGEPPLGIPSFLWGCVFGVIGLVVVYIMTDENKDETKKALWGCVASTAVSIVIYMVAWGAWASTADPYY